MDPDQFIFPFLNWKEAKRKSHESIRQTNKQLKENGKIKH